VGVLDTWHVSVGVEGDQEEGVGEGLEEEVEEVVDMVAAVVEAEARMDEEIVILEDVQGQGAMSEEVVMIVVLQHSVFIVS